MFSVKLLRGPVIILALGSLCWLPLGASDDAAGRTGY